MHSAIPVEQRTGPGAAPGRSGSAPVVIEIRDLDKSFRIPEHRVDSFKERASHPFGAMEYRELHALRRISLDVHKGEFFGIVGRNGSGKSTLLKILASIYQADAGSVRVAGRLAPFIELGVGFNPELNARENTLLNGVLLGLTRKEARLRLDAVLEFAELEDFAELKLKNYSSGMMVRLAFAVMVQADADIMLIDEVLAVGDAGFADKCMDVFRQRRAAGRTIVLVTHDMLMIGDLCDRAMLIHDGEMKFIGEGQECAAKYYRLNFAVDRHQKGEELDRELNAVPDEQTARVVGATLSDERGQRIRHVEQGDPLRLDAVLEAKSDLVRPTFVVHGLTEEQGTVLFEFTLGLEDGGDRVAAGRRLHLSGEIENPLVPGRYMLNCWVRHEGDGGPLAVQALRLLHFTVYGTAPRYGFVSVRGALQMKVQRGRTGAGGGGPA
jgi:ABC-type polysaccharide/polyol phosphate transport system ATPase subunit